MTRIILDLSGPVPVIYDETGKRHEMPPDPNAKVNTVSHGGQHVHKDDPRGAYRAHVLAETISRKHEIPLFIQGSSRAPPMEPVERKRLERERALERAGKARRADERDDDEDESWIVLGRTGRRGDQQDGGRKGERDGVGGDQTAA